MRFKLNRKLIVKIIIALSVVIVVSAITVIALDRLIPKTSVASAPDPAEIIKQYQKTDGVGELGSLYDKKDKPTAGLEVIYYTADNSYTIYAKANDTVQFEQKDKTIKTNSSAVKNNSEAFLVKNNLKKKSVASASSSLFSLFDSEKTVCQLIDLPSSGENGATLTLSCVKKTEINDQYATINKLLALYSGSKSDIADPVGVKIRTMKDDNKTLSTLDVYGLKSGSGAVSLIFAAIGDSWEYIGKRTISNGETVVDNSVSAELKVKINDSESKYGKFLQDNIK